MALEVIKRLGVRADECLVVGDTLFDIEIGKRPGLHTVLIIRKPILLDIISIVSQKNS